MKNYVEISTGRKVRAIQAGHEGGFFKGSRLLRFVEGDWLVDTGFDTEKTIVTNDDFIKQFVPEGQAINKRYDPWGAFQTKNV